MNVDRLNAMSAVEAAECLQKCCGSSAWTREMVASRPFKSGADVVAVGDVVWNGLTESDWLEAFEHHPQIGDIESLRTKFKSTANLAGSEQAGAMSASDAVLKQLRDANIAYKEKNGFIFIVCATGKSADEMLQILNSRLANDRNTELQNAAVEQAKITKLRLEKI